MLRFKMETGKEVSDISNDVTDMCTYLFCCIASACKHDGVEFGLSLMDFADSVTLDDVAAWTEAINGDAAGVEASAEKKLEILELLGIAVGNIGIPYSDFAASRPRSSTISTERGTSSRRHSFGTGGSVCA